MRCVLDLIFGLYLSNSCWSNKLIFELRSRKFRKKSDSSEQILKILTWKMCNNSNYKNEKWKKKHPKISGMLYDDSEKRVSVHNCHWNFINTFFKWAVFRKKQYFLPTCFNKVSSNNKKPNIQHLFVTNFWNHILGWSRNRFFNNISMFSTEWRIQWSKKDLFNLKIHSDRGFWSWKIIQLNFESKKKSYIWDVKFYMSCKYQKS